MKIARILVSLALLGRSVRARRVQRLSRGGRIGDLQDARFGGRRFLDMPLGDPVPRIC